MQTKFWKLAMVIIAVVIGHIQCDKSSEPEIGNITGTVTDSKTGKTAKNGCGFFIN